MAGNVGLDNYVSVGVVFVPGVITKSDGWRFAPPSL
jgi:hypothetical protein